MNDTAPKTGLGRKVAILAGTAVLMGMLTAMETRQAAIERDPAVLETRAREEARQEAELKAFDKRSRKHDRTMAFLHYLTLAILVLTALLMVVAFLGPLAARENAIRQGKPIPPMPDMSMPPYIPIH